jgi:UrcA family protein
MTNTFRAALLAAGAVLAASAASAQDYNDNGYQYGPGYQDQSYPDEGYRNGPPEEVIVIAPDYYGHRPYPSNPTGHPPEQTTLSLAVAYNDLDLTTRDGARELRERVRDAAHNICGELASRYPIRMAVSEPCYKKAVENGLNRADTAIHEARYDRRDDYEY